MTASTFGLVSAVLCGLAVAMLLLRLYRTRTRAAEQPPIHWITPLALNERLIGEHAMTIVDVRGADEFIGPLGHLPKARNIPLAELTQRMPELGPVGVLPIVVICHTDKRSKTAAGLLDAAGYANVSVLRGGMLAWQHEGLQAVC